jgi:hypothetical protein
MFTVPDDATPADLIGETNVLPGQTRLVRDKLEWYVNQILRGEMPWKLIQSKEPMAFQQGSNGLVIDQGHHRWVAALLAGVETPVKIQIRRDYWPGAVAFAKKWSDVEWSDESDDYDAFD